MSFDPLDQLLLEMEPQIEPGTPQRTLLDETFKEEQDHEAAATEEYEALN